MEMVLCIASPADRQCCEVGSNAGQSFMENGILAPELLRLHKLQSATTALFAHNNKVPLLLVRTVGLNITTTVSARHKEEIDGSVCCGWETNKDKDKPKSFKLG